MSGLQLLNCAFRRGILSKSRHCGACISSYVALLQGDSQSKSTCVIFRVQKTCPFHTSSSCLLKFRKHQKTQRILTIFVTPSCPTRSQNGPKMVSKIRSKKYKFCLNTSKILNAAIAITCVWQGSQCNYWNLEVLQVLGKWTKILTEKVYLLSIANTSNLQNIVENVTFGRFLKVALGGSTGPQFELKISQMVTKLHH